MNLRSAHKMSCVYVQCVWSAQSDAACKDKNDFHKSWLKLNDVHLHIVCITLYAGMMQVTFCSITCNYVVTLLVGSSKRHTQVK